MPHVWVYPFGTRGLVIKRQTKEHQSESDCVSMVHWSGAKLGSRAKKYIQGVKYFFNTGICDKKIFQDVRLNPLGNMWILHYAQFFMVICLCRNSALLIGLAVNVQALLNQIKCVSWGWFISKVSWFSSCSISDWWHTPLLRLNCISNVFFIQSQSTPSIPLLTYLLLTKPYALYLF